MVDLHGQTNSLTERVLKSGKQTQTYSQLFEGSENWMANSKQKLEGVFP